VAVGRGGAGQGRQRGGGRGGSGAGAVVRRGAAAGVLGRFENQEEEGFGRSDGSRDGLWVPRVVLLLVAVGLPRTRFAGRASSSLSARPNFCRPNYHRVAC
jgi:hypothetical protein